jgi:hypothetical protein
MVRGRLLYVPKKTLDEIDDIKKAFKINRNVIAFEKMAQSSKALRFLSMKKKDKEWLEGII